MSETRLTTNGPPVHTTTTTAVTAPAPPTECEHEIDCDMYHDGECYECLIDQKDARIRELVGDVEERDRQMAWALKSSKTKDVLRRQMAENKRAALARSEGGT